MGRDFPGAVVVNARDAGSGPGLGRSPGGGHGNPLQYSCLEKPMNRGAWRATVHGVTKSCTQLNVRAHAHTHTRMGYSPWGHKELDMTECTHTHKPRRLSNS